MNNQELLPCPFCGGVDVSICYDDYDFARWARCNQCECTGALLPIQPGTKEAALAGVVRNWNKRSGAQTACADATHHVACSAPRSVPVGSPGCACQSITKALSCTAMTPKERLTRWVDEFVEFGDMELNATQCAVRFRDAIEAAFE